MRFRFVCNVEFCVESHKEKAIFMHVPVLSVMLSLASRLPSPGYILGIYTVT